jgi:hypothetical protein
VFPLLLLALPAVSLGGQSAQPAVSAVEPVDHEMVAKMRDEGFRRSQVMEIVGYMTDVFGPRYANTRAYDQAAHWAKEKFEEFGLENVVVEPWGEYGLGWENTFTSVHMLTPQYQPMIAYAEPDTRGTDGKVRGEVVFVDTSRIFDDSDLTPYRGELNGKIVFTQPKRRLELNFNPDAVRLSDEELREMARLDIAGVAAAAKESEETQSEGYGEDRRRSGPRPLAREQLEDFFESEGVSVLASPGGSNTGPMDKGTVLVSGSHRTPVGETPPMTSIIVSPEHYNRVMRVLEKGIPVEMEVEIRSTFHDDDPLDYNVIAEIPGSDLAHEIVLIGGHYDGEPSGTGATDNASGAASVMEAMRILKAVGAQPRRTVRAALWGAEESGLLGSRGYVRKHLGDRETQAYLPEHENFSVYFNMDWYGRFRGIFLQGNDRTRHIFEAWMTPFHDVGMSWIVPGNTGGSDHMAFLEVGVPGFQFIQDDLEFFTTTFHTNMDVYDRLVADDLMQASVILASFAYHAAMRDEMFPRADGINNGRRWHK